MPSEGKLLWYLITIANERHGEKFVELRKVVLSLKQIDFAFRLYTGNDIRELLNRDHRYFLSVPEDRITVAEPCLTKYQARACGAPDQHDVVLIA